jgi:hypothetical protein
LLRGIAVLIVAITFYSTVYLTVRTCFRAVDGRLKIDTGSRIANRIFAPAIHLERLSRERLVPRPEDELARFLAESRTSQKPLLVALGAPPCLPCRQLEQFLHEQRAILSKHFVVVKASFDGEMSVGQLVSDRFRVPRETAGYLHYFPWLVFLNENGEVVVTADDGPKGRIGIPQGGPDDRAWFLRMLRIARPQISDAEIAELGRAAEAYHRRIWLREDSPARER